MKKILLASLISLIVLLAAGFLYKMRSGSTPQIKDSAGKPLQGSTALLEKVELGGFEQWVQIRGNDVRNPVLLWLHGGPGAAQMPVARYFNGALEEHFIVVHWDQRSAGKSNSPDFDESTMTFQQFLADAHELTLYLKTRFDQDKIFLVGHSWGSQIGIKLGQDYPEDYYAYVGVSQVVNQTLAQEEGYSWLVEQVKMDGSQKNLNVLEEIGNPPFNDHEKFVRFAHLVDAYGGSFDVSMGKLARITLLAPEYSLGDMLAWLKGSTRGSGPMWNDPECQNFNALIDISHLEIPVYFFSGLQDYNTPLQLVKRYYDALEAPLGKELVVFNSSAHTPFFGEAEKFNQELVRVKQDTYKP